MLFFSTTKIVLPCLMKFGWYQVFAQNTNQSPPKVVFALDCVSEKQPANRSIFLSLGKNAMLTDFFYKKKSPDAH